MTEALAETPAEPAEHEPADEDEQTADGEGAAEVEHGGGGEPEARCDIEATIGGNQYRCALQEGHDGPHSWQAAAEGERADKRAAKDHAKAIAALDNEAVRHANRIREIMGDDANDLVLCALCPPNLAGWRFDGAPDEDVSRQVRAAIGLPDVSNYLASGHEHVCADCAGLGRVRTGSLVQGNETAVCEPCGGRGWVATRERVNAPAAPAEAPAAPVGGVGADGIRRDMFGTPEGDPDYNLLPQSPPRQRPVEYWQQLRG